MNQFTTRQVAKKLGISLISLARYISAKKVPAPEVQKFGGKFRAWTENDIESVRKLLPKIKNGRKTRYQKKRSATGDKQSAQPRRKSKSQKPKAKRRKH